jgi:hypothetical protein
MFFMCSPAGLPPPGPRDGPPVANKFEQIALRRAESSAALLRQQAAAPDFSPSLAGRKLTAQHGEIVGRGAPGGSSGGAEAHTEGLSAVQQRYMYEVMGREDASVVGADALAAGREVGDAQTALNAALALYGARAPKERRFASKFGSCVLEQDAAAFVTQGR